MSRKHFNDMPKSLQDQVAQVDAVWRRIDRAMVDGQPVASLFDTLDSIYGRRRRAGDSFDGRGGGEGESLQADWRYQQRPYRSRKPRKRRS